MRGVTVQDMSPAQASPRPHVLHIITHLDMGGAEGVAMQLIGTLRQAMDFSLFAVLQSATPGRIGQEMAAALAGWRVPVGFGVRGRFKSGGVLLAAIRLIRMVARQRPDVIHVHTEIPELTLALACVLSCRVRRTPLLRTVHNSQLWLAWGGIGRWVTARLAHGDAVAVSHAAAAADAAIATPVKRPVADVIYNGVALPQAADARQAGGPVRILFAGRLVEQKGADLLPGILAAAHGLTPRRDVAVVIAGSGILQAQLQAGLAGVAPGWDIRLVPPIEHLSSQLASYDCILQPSRFEGFGLLMLEALLSGVPLLTTDAPGLNEVIPPDYPLQAGVDDVPRLAALLAGVIDDPASFRRMIVSYRDGLAARFSPEAMAGAYGARYRALAACTGKDVPCS